MPMTHSHGATWWGQEVATRWFPTLSEGGENSAPRPPVRLRRHGGGRARPRVAWGARARSTLLAALIYLEVGPCCCSPDSHFNKKKLNESHVNTLNVLAKGSTCQTIKVPHAPVCPPSGSGLLLWKPLKKGYHTRQNRKLLLSHSRSSAISRRGSAVCSLSTVVCLSLIPGRSLRNRYSRFLCGFNTEYKHSKMNLCRLYII